MAVHRYGLVKKLCLIFEYYKTNVSIFDISSRETVDDSYVKDIIVGKKSTG
jgi:hypothetical protein